MFNMLTYCVYEDDGGYLEVLLGLVALTLLWRLREEVRELE